MAAHNPNRIPDVSLVPCPATGNQKSHKIEARGVNQNLTIWTCIYCRKTWAKIDADIRKALA